MYVSELTIENFRMFGEGDQSVVVPFGPGLSALVGENDSGKTAVVDSLRFVLGTRDQYLIPIADGDFHVSSVNVGTDDEPVWEGQTADAIRIRCRFDALTMDEQGTFAEYLSYGENKVSFYVNWIAKRTPGARPSRFRRWAEIRAGKDADGPTLDAEVRELLRATYLRPLRDAEGEMSAGRYSRLSQILHVLANIKDEKDAAGRTILDIGDQAAGEIEQHPAITASSNALDNLLQPLSFRDDTLRSRISMSAANDEEARRRQILEKLELELRAEAEGRPSNRGLGSNNLLFMACEMLLLDHPADEFPIMMIEEPEAHLHPQRQLRVMQFLQDQAERHDVQVIVTTHSPQLASVLKLENAVILKSGCAYPLARNYTKLNASDYRFLERFLDATKANLFFARGVIIVEGDAENILLPTIARLIERDLTEAGVSIVNVGHRGLYRYARIFQRNKGPDLDIPVACLVDMDVMPACAPAILGLDVHAERRRWKSELDFDAGALEQKREQLRGQASGGSVKTFVSNLWTFEYELAYAGLLDEVWLAACMSKSEGAANAVRGRAAQRKVLTQTEFGDDHRAIRATHCYSHFTDHETEFAPGRTSASKSIAAQYLAQILTRRYSLKPNELRARLPQYILDAVDYVVPGGG